MTRFLFTWFAAIAILAGTSLPATAQAPVATPDPYALTMNHRILRIREGNDFQYLRLNGSDLAYVDGDLVDDGLSTVPVPVSLEQWYTALRMQDMYYAYAIMVPEGEQGVANAVVVDIRLISFPDRNAAGVMVPASVGVLIQQAEVDPNASRDIALIEEVPAHDEAIIGITGTDPSVNIRTGEQGLSRVPFSRFIAQNGTIVASVKVTGPDEAYNDAAARALLAAQLRCLEEGGACVPIPLPVGTTDQPGTPVASPIAVRLVSRGRRP